jgi:signal transduction histidine kinase
MHERVRLLDGEMRISSRAGGPTVISVMLPAWPAVEPHSV